MTQSGGMREAISLAVVHRTQYMFAFLLGTHRIRPVYLQAGVPCVGNRFRIFASRGFGLHLLWTSYM